MAKQTKSDNPYADLSPKARASRTVLAANRCTTRQLDADFEAYEQLTGERHEHDKRHVTESKSQDPSRASEA